MMLTRVCVMLCVPFLVLLPRAFDSPTWHCIVGKNYGSDIVHQTKNFIYFYLGPLAILLFKSG